MARKTVLLCLEEKEKEKEGPKTSFTKRWEAGALSMLGKRLHTQTM